jgi:hypothetical protein
VEATRPDPTWPALIRQATQSHVWETQTLPEGLLEIGNLKSADFILSMVRSRLPRRFFRVSRLTRRFSVPQGTANGQKSVDTNMLRHLDPVLRRLLAPHRYQARLFVPPLLGRPIVLLQRQEVQRNRFRSMSAVWSSW